MTTLLLIAACILNAAAGALWRRWLGSGPALGPRWLKFFAMPVLPLFFLFPWPHAIAVSALVALFFAMGHKVDSSRVWLRYGPFALGYVLARRYWPAGLVYLPLIDGWMAVGELFLGGAFFGLLPLLLFFR